MSALETSVTLEEVFGVVNAKRVPLAPELAGYLALEIAEGADGAGGDVDPKFVFIGEEGTVGLVRPKREGAVGSAEGSVRTILARLLEASGSQTPALGTASKRRAGSGLPSLVEELEAALIPVNRAAGRRALARLAREVKRVTLGVGRNASMPPEAPPRRASAPSYSAVTQEPRPAPVPLPEPEPPVEKPAPRSVRPPTPPAAFPHEEERTTTRGAIPDEVRATDRPFTDPDSSAPTARAPIHDASELPTVEFTPGPVAKPRDSVDSLIASFGVSSKTDQQVSRELKAMVGIDATAPPPRVAGRDSQVDALMAMTEESGPAPRASAASIPDRAEAQAPPPSSKSSRKKPAQDEPRTRDASRDRDPPAPMRGPQISYSDDRQLPTGPSQIRVRASSDDLAKPRRGGMLLLVALIALGVGALVIWRLKPGIFSGRTQEKIDAEKQQAEIDKQKQVQAAQASACRATLVVTDVPPHAEVLKLVGQAPTDVARMPVGTRLEFVATAEGYAPKRTVLATGAAWDTGADGKPRIELPVQLEKSKAKPGQIDLWPAGEPGSEAGGNGPPGTVHVVSSPKGAEIWLLAGFGPEATIAQLPCDVDVDLLVAGPTTLRKRMHVAGADFKEGGDVKGGRAARISAK